MMSSSSHLPTALSTAIQTSRHEKKVSHVASRSDETHSATRGQRASFFPLLFLKHQHDRDKKKKRRALAKRRSVAPWPPALLLARLRLASPCPMHLLVLLLASLCLLIVSIASCCCSCVAYIFSYCLVSPFLVEQPVCVFDSDFLDSTVGSAAAAGRLIPRIYDRLSHEPGTSRRSKGASSALGARLMTLCTKDGRADP